jgi:hypothetical protein
MNIIFVYEEKDFQNFIKRQSFNKNLVLKEILIQDLFKLNEQIRKFRNKLKRHSRLNLDIR